MRYQLLIFIGAIIVFTNCVRDKIVRETSCNLVVPRTYVDKSTPISLCSDEVCANYLVVWKQLIMEKNKLTPAYFDAHIELRYASLQSWNDGISMSVCYTVKIDWAEAYNCDQFIVKINAGNKLYPSLDLPRDTYLSKEKIKLAVDNKAFSSEIIKIAPVDKINYTTPDDALNNLIDFSGVSQLCFNQIGFDKESGNLVLKASAQYTNEENLCVEGIVDLVTGKKSVTDTPCWIN